jgi:uncharacterized LabA/DUF88 family protein
MKPTVAVLIDGGFFLKRYPSLYSGAQVHTPAMIARNIYRAALKHVSPDHELYRIFYYDCFPFGKMAHNPISKKAVDFSRTGIYSQRLALFEELKKKRKLALRLGHIKDSGSWQIYPAKVKALLKGEISFGDLKETDVFYEMRQKGIDMKIGVDIASLALKKQVYQIVILLHPSPQKQSLYHHPLHHSQPYQNSSGLDPYVNRLQIGGTNCAAYLQISAQCFNIVCII